MTLTPVEGPTSRYRKLKATIETVISDGIQGQWYLVNEYENHETARSAAYRLRREYENAEIRAEKGTVYARKVQ